MAATTIADIKQQIEGIQLPEVKVVAEVSPTTWLNLFLVLAGSFTLAAMLYVFIIKPASK